MVIIPITLIIVGITALLDIKTNRIPNYITFPAIALGLILNSYFMGLDGFRNALVGMSVGTLLLIVPFALGGMGAGDVKLLAAIGALNGGIFAFHTFLYGAITGGLIAVVILLVKGQLYSVLFNLFCMLRNFSAFIFKRGQRQQIMPWVTNIRFPYGTSIFVGTIAAFLVR